MSLSILLWIYRISRAVLMILGIFLIAQFFLGCGSAEQAEQNRSAPATVTTCKMVRYVDRTNCTGLNCAVEFSGATRVFVENPYLGQACIGADSYWRMR